MKLQSCKIFNSLLTAGRVVSKASAISALVAKMQFSLSAFKNKNFKTLTLKLEPEK